MPANECRDIVFEGRAGARIDLLCGKDSIWTTGNGGHTWIRVFKPQSLFAEK
jgi:hypothetical protein